jgi:hypothetical protein
MRKLGTKPYEWVAGKWCRDKKQQEAAKGILRKGISKELHRRVARKTQSEVSLQNEVFAQIRPKSLVENPP